MMTRRGLVIIAAVLLVCPGLAAGQIAVIDGANLAQAVATVQHMITLIALARDDLAALPSLGTVLDVIAALESASGELDTVIAQVQARASGWDELTATIPCTVTDLRAWNGRALAWGKDGVSEARQLVHVGRTTLGLAHRLGSLLGGIFGTTSGLQALSGQVGLLITETKLLQTISLPFQQSLLGDVQTGQVNQLAAMCLAAKRLEGWGKVTTW
jgi:hypothetical protein